MNACLNAVKDANPRIAQLGLDCSQIFIDNIPLIFQPLNNVAFDLFLNKFGDVKVSVKLVSSGNSNVSLLQLQSRTRANEVMVSLINAIGLATGLEKLLVRILNMLPRAILFQLS